MKQAHTNSTNLQKCSSQPRPIAISIRLRCPDMGVTWEIIDG